MRDFTLVDLGQVHNVKENVWEGLMTFYPTWITAAIVFGGITISGGSAIAQKKYDVGASATEIKLGRPCLTVDRRRR